MHDTEVQGPVRYMRHYEQPRFTPAAADAWGLSVRATWIYEVTGGKAPSLLTTGGGVENGLGGIDGSSKRLSEDARRQTANTLCLAGQSEQLVS